MKRIYMVDITGITNLYDILKLLLLQLKSMPTGRKRYITDHDDRFIVSTSL